MQETNENKTLHETKDVEDALQIRCSRKDVDACRIDSWFETFRKHSFKANMIPLSDEFVSYLKSDGLYLPKGVATYKGKKPDIYDDDYDSESEFNDVEEEDDEDEGEEQSWFTEATTQQHQRKELRILSHNLWCHYVMRSPDKLERMQEFMKILEDMQRNESRQYDVLILQEVFAFKAFSSDALKWDAPKQHVIKEAERLGFIYKADDGDKCPPLFGQTSGLLVLSKYPILSLREFLWRTWTDFGTGKGALHCVIDFDNTPVHIVCVHLDAHSSAQRTTQVAEIKNQILKPLAFAAAEQQQQQQSPSPSPHSNFFSVPLIIAGDFNIPSHTQEYEAMMQMLNQFEDDANNNNNKNNNNTSPDMQKIRDVFADEHPQTFRNFAGKCIDHVLISPHWEVVARRVEDFQYKASNNTPAASPIAAASPAFSPIPPPSSPTTTTTTATATATATTISGPVVHTPSGLDTKIVSDHLGLSVTLRIRC